jgi:hypothetical protein
MIGFEKKNWAIGIKFLLSPISGLELGKKVNINITLYSFYPDFAEGIRIISVNKIDEFFPYICP